MSKTSGKFVAPITTIPSPVSNLSKRCFMYETKRNIHSLHVILALSLAERLFQYSKKTISAGLIKFSSKLLWAEKSTFNSDKKIILVIPSVLQYL